jgi:hypothetical protein
MRTIRAFLLGVIEFRSSYTIRVEDRALRAYEWGREIAHRVTCRRFED